MNGFVEEILRMAPEIKKVSDFIHGNPEMGFEERKAAKAQIELLNAWGFKVESPVAGLDTAFKASWGSGSPVFCFMSEYDALPGIGHACGHNLIAAGALAAAFALKESLEKNRVTGTVVLMGTPGEEGKGGKVIMAEKGAFRGVDAGLISHPYDETLTDPGWLSVSRYLVSYRGSPSHASVSPEMGINALDSVIQLFNSVNAWRQLLPEPSRVHGIITHGGEAPNIIPDFAEAFFYIRAGDCKTQRAMEERFKEIAQSAALAAGTKIEIKMVSAYKSSIYNVPLNEEFASLGPDFGLETQRVSPNSGRGSSDFGDVSQVVPSAQFHYSIVPKGSAPLHSLEFARAAGSDFAFSQTMKAAAAMASIGLKYISDKAFRYAVDADFRAKANPSP